MSGLSCVRLCGCIAARVDPLLPLLGKRSSRGFELHPLFGKATVAIVERELLHATRRFPLILYQVQLVPAANQLALGRARFGLITRRSKVRNLLLQAGRFGLPDPQLLEQAASSRAGQANAIALHAV